MKDFFAAMLEDFFAWNVRELKLRHWEQVKTGPAKISCKSIMKMV